MAERILVRDLMNVGVPSCAVDTPITELARLLLEKHEEAVVVLNADKHAVGVVSRDELVKAYARDDRRQLTAEQVMRDEVPQLPPDIPLTAAAQLMQDMGVRTVYIVHHSEGVTYPAAMLTYEHLLRHLSTPNDDDLADLGVKASRQDPLSLFFERRDAARRQNQIPGEE